VSSELPQLAEPITGLRVVAYPQADLPGGGWGAGPQRGRTAKKPETKGTFVLTAISATADAIPGDQVDLYKLLEIARVTARSWDEKFPPAGVLDPRNDDGWSPDNDAAGPVHLTVTFGKPIQADQTPFLTTQLNFGHGQNMVPGRVEILTMTGEDDDTDLPPAGLESIQRQADERTPADIDRLWAHCAAHAEEQARTRVDLANLKERLAVLTEPFPAMVMDVAEKPRETFILNRGDYAQPTEKV